MKLPTMPTSFINEIEEMRIKKGDVIEFEGEIYTVREVGLKYVIAVLDSNPRVERWLKHQQVIRWTPPDNQPADVITEPINLSEKFNRLGPRD